MIGSLVARAEGTRLEFDGKAPVSVGRDSDCELVIARDDRRVSRRHATLHVEAGGWRWTDTSSRGTFVNGDRVSELLVHGPVTLRLGADDGPRIDLDVATPSRSGDRPAAALWVTGPAGSAVVAPGERLTVGRQPGALEISDPRVGRQHLSIWYDPSDGWTALDESRWGTWLDGARVKRVVIDRPLVVRLADPTDGPTIKLDPSESAASGRVIVKQNPLGGPLRQNHPGPGSLSMMRAAAQLVRIGRAPDNDIVVADDLRVSRHHAEIRRAGDVVEVVDLGSPWGTYVNGVAVDRATVEEGAVVGVGLHLFIVRADRVEEYVDDRARLEAHGLRVTVDRGHKVLLDDVSFTVEPGQLVAVVGPSGAGKSTLLRALTGFSPAQGGTVSYNGRDLYAAIAELRFRIGYVPQDDIIHAQLSLRRALLYAAELRFGSDTTSSDRSQRVDEVLAELDLIAVAQVRIDRLSGGQRKRASVALELLTKPSLLFLDEPTTGLDPHLERSVMGLLRTLADDGRSVVVITHATASLDRCHRVLVLGAGGKVAYFGPPADALSYFGAKDWADVFSALDERRVDWADRFKAGRPPVPRERSKLAAAVDSAPGAARPKPAGPPPLKQFWTLLRRNISLLVAARSYAVMLVAQAPIVAAILLIVFGSGNLAGPGSKARIVLLLFVVAAVAMGLVNACREIVRELAIYRRERTVGLSLTAYLGSKTALLAAFAFGQTAVLVAIAVRPQGLGNGPPGGSSLAELAVILFVTVLASSCLGLAVSALVSTDSAALVLIPVLIVAQMAFANALFDVAAKPGVAELAWVTPSYWGFAGVASAANLEGLDPVCKKLPGMNGQASSPTIGRTGSVPCSPLFAGTATNMMVALALLALLTLFYLAMAAVFLRRRDPIRLRGPGTH